MLIPTWTRLMQLAVLTPTTIATSILVSQRLACIGWVLLALLYVDDWLTGDDEEWGRFKKWLKRRRLQLAFGGAR